MNGQKPDILIILIGVDVIIDVFNMVYLFWGDGGGIIIQSCPSSTKGSSLSLICSSAYKHVAWD